MVLFALAAAACGGSPASTTGTKSAQGKPIVVGVIVDNSGPSKAYSATTLSGLQAAVKAFNSGQLFNAAPPATRGLPGIAGRPIELSIQDSTGDANISLTKTRLLISQGVDAIISTTASFELLQDRVACTESKIVCISPFNNQPAIVQGPTGQFSFLMAPTAAQQSAQLAKGISASGCKDIVVAHDPAPPTQQQIAATVPVLSAEGITVTDRVEIPLNSIDISGQIARIKSKNPCSVLDIVNPANDDATFLRAYQAAGIKSKLFGLGGIVSSPDVWKLAGPAINGLVAVDVISPKNKYAAAFKDYYLAQNGASSNFLSVHVEALAALSFLKYGFETANASSGQSDGPAIKAAMEGLTNFPSPVGQVGYTQTWTASDHIGAKVSSMVLLQFSNGKPTTVWSGYQPPAS
jgi:ABC-type branched-subunit amino acid transport system substrate-binding protein